MTDEAEYSSHLSSPVVETVPGYDIATYRVAASGVLSLGNDKTKIYEAFCGWYMGPGRPTPAMLSRIRCVPDGQTHFEVTLTIRRGPEHLARLLLSTQGEITVERKSEVLVLSNWQGIIEQIPLDAFKHVESDGTR